MRPLLDAQHIAPEAAQRMSSFHADVVAEVKAAVAKDAVVIVGMAQNPHVKRARQTLAQAGVAFTYLEYGSYFSQWKKRLAIKLWSGWPTFPQVYVKGTLLGGADAAAAAIADGTLNQRLAG